MHVISDVTRNFTSNLKPIGIFALSCIHCSIMHHLHMTNFGLRFTLAGWYQAAKSAKLNRQRKLVYFNTVIGFSGLFVVIHVH